jgi:hypothetical protein
MKQVLIALLLNMSFTSAFSLNETTPPVVAQPNTLQQQYKNLKSDLEIVNGFRMIKMYTMDKFWTVVEDSLNAKKSKINESAVLIANQKEELRALKLSVVKIEEEKKALVAGVESIIVLGRQYSKTDFITVVSFVIVGLLVLAGVLFSASRISYQATRELKKLNESLNQEFDRYKHNAIEKEIKLSRELQNHRNKLADLKMA